jgi:hypothetical protein
MKAKEIRRKITGRKESCEGRVVEGEDEEEEATAA